MDSSSSAHVLVVAYKTAATPALVEAVRERAERSPAHFTLAMPNPVHADWRPSSIQHPDLSEGEQMLSLALPLLQEAAGGRADGFVSRRHDPMDTIEEALMRDDYDEIILSTLPHRASAWLHFDLPSRVAHLGLPLTVVTPGVPVSA